MDILEAIHARHSVRNYVDRPIEGETLAQLQTIVETCAQESDLDIQLVLDNPEAFQVVARFGLIHGASANVAFIVRDTGSDEAVGYWGQRIVLEAQRLGLNTCWVGTCARSKVKATVPEGMMIRLIIAVGYGKTQGKERKTKPASELITCECAQAPDWFEVAVAAAQLAPTAMNNQHFHITLRADSKTVLIESPKGMYNVIDRGIVKRNFEEAADALGADWQWE